MSHSENCSPIGIYRHFGALDNGATNPMPEILHSTGRDNTFYHRNGSEDERPTSVASCVTPAVKTTELELPSLSSSSSSSTRRDGRGSAGKLLRAQLLHFITASFASTSLPCSRLYSVFVRRSYPETFETRTKPDAARPCRRPGLMSNLSSFSSSTCEGR